MIHSYSKIKTDGNFNEDFKTFSTLGILQFLPGNLFWRILNASVVDNDQLPRESGEILKIEFWPKWDDLTNINNVGNTRYIEPDVFIKFENFDCIIEVKKTDHGGQYEAQWESQILAYFNKFGRKHKLIYIALGGNMSLNTNKKFPTLYKMTWHNLLKQIHLAYMERKSSNFKTSNIMQEIRILEFVIQSFARYNEYLSDLMKTIIPIEITLPSSSQFNCLWKI